MALDEKTQLNSLLTARPSAAAGAKTPGKATRARPLPSPLREKLESSLGESLAEVRIHEDSQEAVEHGAQAFALGNDIHFAPGAYDPSNESLIAHEVAHVVQQRGAAPVAKPQTTTPGDGAETNADSAAAAMLNKGKPDIKGQPQQIARKKPGEHTVSANPLDMFDIQAATPIKSGEVKVTTAKTTAVGPAGGDDKDLVVWAPGISMTPFVKLKEDIDPDPDPIKVGWVQAIESSVRIGVYERNGKKANRDVYRMPVTHARDVLPAHQDDEGRDVAAAEKPWYVAPSLITKTKRSAVPAMSDQPKIELPKERAAPGGGKLKLTAVEGADTFTSTLKAGAGTGLTTLRSFSWHASWNLPDVRAAGIIEGDPKEGDLGIAPTTADGLSTNDDKTPNQMFGDKGNHHSGYASVEEAVDLLKNATIPEYFRELEHWKTEDQPSYWNMVGALWRSQQTVKVNLVPFGNDAENVTVKLTCGSKSVTLPKGKGPDYTATAFAVYDPGNIGAPIEVSVNDAKVGTLKPPFVAANIDKTSVKVGGIGGHFQSDFSFSGSIFIEKEK